MSTSPPPELATLLSASDPGSREAAWGRFVAAHSRLLIDVARSLGGDHDAAMDRYAHVLEQLQEGDFRRLRGYLPDGRTKFTTWLAVVVRRLCFDHHRQRYGRGGVAGEASAQARALRRQLADSIGADVDIESVPAASPDDHMGNLEGQRQLALLESVLAQLSPADRLLLKLRFEDGLSAREIAGLLGLPTAFHVYRRLNALYTVMRRELEQRGLRDLEA